MLYDTHAHVNFAAFKSEHKDLIERTLSDGVWLNNVGTQKDTASEAVRIANEFKEGVYAVVGLHPIHTTAQHVDEEESSFDTREEAFDYEYYKTLAMDSKVVGIGETGLDYYRIPDGMSKEQVQAIQKPVFREHIRLSKELDKALVIHCRASKDTTDAYEDIIEILKQEKPERFEIHSFTADWQICQKFLELGAYIGLNGIITFDKTGTLKEVVTNCPIERMVLETDAPYLSPAPYRGKRNEPAYVKYVAEYIAQVKEISIEEVSDSTFENSKQLFKIK
jgi:TatD DNase family protein